MCRLLMLSFIDILWFSFLLEVETNVLEVGNITFPQSDNGSQIWPSQLHNFESVDIRTLIYFKSRLLF